MIVSLLKLPERDVRFYLALLIAFALSGCATQMESIQADDNISLAPNEAIIIVGVHRTGPLAEEGLITVGYNTLLGGDRKVFHHRGGNNEKDALAFVVPINSEFTIKFLNGPTRGPEYGKTFYNAVTMRVEKSGIYYYGTVGSTLRKHVSLPYEYPVVVMSPDLTSPMAATTMERAKAKYPNVFRNYPVINYK